MTRMVTVRLVDGGEVTVPEPDWCLGHREAAASLPDLVHDGREIGLRVRTRRGEVRVLQAALAAYPFATDPARRGPLGTVLLGDQWFEMGPAELVGLAEGLTGYAGQLRAMAGKLRQLAG